MKTRREKLEAMLQKEPNDAFLNFGLAMELVKEGLTDRAVASFDNVLRNDPDYTAAHYHKGNTLIAAGRLGEAKEVLTVGVAAARRVGNSHAEGEMLGLLDGIAS